GHANSLFCGGPAGDLAGQDRSAGPGMAADHRQRSPAQAAAEHLVDLGESGGDHALGQRHPPIIALRASILAHHATPPRLVGPRPSQAGPTIGPDTGAARRRRVAPSERRLVAVEVVVIGVDGVGEFRSLLRLLGKSTFAVGLALGTTP